jgi:hypothetical protein
MSQIIITAQNVANANNNEYVFNLPTTVDFTGLEVCVQSIQINYCWDSINANIYNNANFSYQWYNNTTGDYDSFQVVLPDGLWSIADINGYLQYTMIQNNHYSVDTATGNNVYYINMEINSVLYAVQVNTYPILPTAPLGITYQFTAPTEQFNPMITFPANFCNIVGYAANFTTTQSNAGTILSFTSSSAPQVQPSPTLMLSCSCVYNKYMNPSSILFALTPNVDVGASFYIQPFPVYSPCIGGQFRQLRLTWMNSNYQAIPLQDPTCCIVLLIRQAPKN